MPIAIDVAVNGAYADALVLGDPLTPIKGLSR